MYSMDVALEISMRVFISFSDWLFGWGYKMSEKRQIIQNLKKRLKEAQEKHASKSDIQTLMRQITNIKYFY